MEKLLVVILVFMLLVSCAHVPKKEVQNKEVVKPKVAPEKVVAKKVKPSNIELLFPIKGGDISSEFGVRPGGHYHKGVDIAAPTGTPIKACMDGKIVSAGRVKFLTGYGNAVLISHGNSIYTYYAHLSKVKVKKGYMVNQGEVIGNVGITGKCRGPHLHLELIIKEHNHNPVPYFFIADSVTKSAVIWLRGVKKSVSTGLGLKKLIGDW